MKRTLQRIEEKRLIIWRKTNRAQIGGSKLTWATQPGFSSFMLSQAEPLLTLTTSKCMEWEADSAASLCLRLQRDLKYEIFSKGRVLHLQSTCCYCNLQDRSVLQIAVQHVESKSATPILKTLQVADFEHFSQQLVHNISSFLNVVRY